MNRLIVLRHGQTAWNDNGRVQGISDVDLDDVGRRQAARAAPTLAKLRPSLIVSSDLSRALDTARAVADLVGTDVVIDKRLRERAYGPWEGLNHAEIEAAFPKEFAAWKARKPFEQDGIESPVEVAARGKEVLEDYASRLGETALLVSHGGLSRAAVGSFLNWTFAQIGTVRGLDNCHWADLQMGRSGWLLYGYNIAALPE
ncbi:MAG: histidine phosphatase family protein [Stackebrandtia sp.]